jgi:hypothetical protein
MKPIAAIPYKETSRPWPDLHRSEPRNRDVAYSAHKKSRGAQNNVGEPSDATLPCHNP